jgi:hypothetical protein
MFSCPFLFHQMRMFHPVGYYLSDSSHQKGEAALMDHWKGSFAGANGNGIFDISIGERENRRVE